MERKGIGRQLIYLDYRNSVPFQDHFNKSLMLGVYPDQGGHLSIRHLCTVPGGLHKHPIIFTVQMGISAHLIT